MTVYRHKGQSVWLYDFQHKRRRYHGSTGTSEDKRLSGVPARPTHHPFNRMVVSSNLTRPTN